jgi:thymidylate synthase
MAPTVISGQHGISTYAMLVRAVIEQGRHRPSRNGDTLDLGHVITYLHSPFAALPLGVGRQLNRKIAAAEACQLIGAFSDPELLVSASPNFIKFMEPELKNFHGAYGERIGHQFPALLHKFASDLGTRQGVITLWDSLRDNQVGKRDYPCTVMLQFEVVDNYVNMHVVMRSNDVWLGVPYDWFQFTQLHITASNLLGIPPGTYTHQSLSTHIYMTDVEKAYGLKVTPTNEGHFESMNIQGFGGFHEDAVFKVMQRAKQVTRSDLQDPTYSERWYRAQFRPERPTPHPSQLGVDLASSGEGPEQPEPVQP